MGAKAPAKWLGAGVTTGTAQVSANTQALANWWALFNDPTLDSLIKRGIEANLDVKLAAERVRQARAVIGENQGLMLPTLGASGSYTRSYTELPKQNGVTGVNRHSSSDSYRAGFDAAWELDVWGKNRRSIEASGADAQQQLENLRNALVTLTAEIGTDYLTLRGQQEQLRITLENLEIQRHSADITRKRYAVGFVSKLDVENAQAQVQSTESDIPSLEGQITQTIYQLSTLLGAQPEALLAELKPAARMPRLPHEIPAGIPSDILERRPDIRANEAAVHAATARIGVAVADLFPQFTLSGSAGWSASKLGNWSHNVTSNYSGGPSVSWNLFNGFRTMFSIKEAQSAARQAVLTYQQTVLTAFQEVESAWIGYDKAIERGRALEQTAAAYRRALTLSQQLYTEGQNDFLSVLDAERSLFNAQNSLSVNRINAANYLVALYKALGGGWQGQDLDAAARAQGESEAKEKLPGQKAPAAEPTSRIHLPEMPTESAGQ